MCVYRHTYMMHFFVNLCIEHLDSIYLLVIVNNAVMNPLVYKCLLECLLSLPVISLLRNKITGSCGIPGVLFFFFLSDSQTVFHRSRTIFNAQRLLFLYLYHHSLHSIKNSPLGLEGWRSSWSGRVPASYQKKKIVLSEWEVEIFISQVLVISSIFSCAYWLFYTFLETCPFKFYAHFYLGYLSFCSFWVARL